MEILHKAKRKDNREWIEGYFCRYQPCASKPEYLYGIVPSYASALYMVEVDPETVCAYTGSEDNNGKKIWENDIVDGHEKRGAAFYRSVVIWNEVKARFDVRTMGCDFPMTLDECDNDISIGGLDYRVIGNIFDNPDMVEDY